MVASPRAMRGNGRGFDLGRQLRLSLAPTLALLLACYFGYHLVQGDRGLLAYLRLTTEVGTARATLAVEEGRVEALSRQVERLRPESLDLDLLEERARVLLNLGAADEVVILTAPASPSPSPAPKAILITPAKRPAIPGRD